MVDGCGEHLVVCFGLVCYNLVSVLAWICFAVSVQVMVCFNPIIKSQFSRVADCIRYSDADLLSFICCFVCIFFRIGHQCLWMCSIYLVRPKPIGIGVEYLGCIPFVVSLYFVSKATFHINIRHLYRDEE